MVIMTFVQRLYLCFVVAVCVPTKAHGGDSAEWPKFAPGSPAAIERAKGHDGCPGLPARLLSALDDARSHGNVLIRSTCGGAHAKNSAHYSGEAVDFRVEGNCAAVAARFAGWDGGYNRIDSCLFHLDVREKRRW